MPRKPIAGKEAHLMRSPWRKLPEPLRHLLGALGVVLILTLPFLALGLNHRCIQLVGCQH